MKFAQIIEIQSTCHVFVVYNSTVDEMYTDNSANLHWDVENLSVSLVDVIIFVFFRRREITRSISSSDVYFTEFEKYYSEINYDVFVRKYTSSNAELNSIQHGR